MIIMIQRYSAKDVINISGLQRRSLILIRKNFAKIVFQIKNKIDTVYLVKLRSSYHKKFERLNL